MIRDAIAKVADLKCLKGAPNAIKNIFMESAWEQFKIQSGWMPSNEKRKSLKRDESYIMAFDQQDSVIRYGILTKSGVEKTKSWPWSDNPSAPKLEKPLADYLRDIRAAGKIPVCLVYWADPNDCEGDDDLLSVHYEAVAGALVH